jgi:hypothetical protein
MESLARLVVIMSISITALIAGCMMWVIVKHKPVLKWHWLWIVPACVVLSFGIALGVLNLIAQIG